MALVRLPVLRARHIHACYRAALLELCLTLDADQVLAVTQKIRAIEVRFGGGCAMQAGAHDALVRCMIDVHGYALIKDIAFAVPERPLCVRVLPVADDSTIELKDVREALMDHEGC